MAEDWSAAQYLKFEDERTRPSRDLLAQVPLAQAGLCIDLGCGPGNSTELVAARFPAAEVRGIDTSPDMLTAARKRLPTLAFQAGDVRTFTLERPADLIFANAVLQWVPDHEALFPRLMSQLAPGGYLAVQMPDNLDQPSHAEMRAAAGDGAWSAKLAEAMGMRERLLSVEAYYDLLAPHAARVEIWHTIYRHPLAGTSAIVEWLKSTGLRPFLDPLDAPERAAYLSAYEARLARHYTTRADGKVLLAFPRLFILARR
ncbi:trans-aconitate 2-methyltransferase [Aquabacter spiritensis]|uniref:Trans-aconitate 2-methyltransferase n=1 Tax=Aquabacter spiritensis TaxID=933073 RepID=A0A4R3LX33_9HYPH|nr:trans-aconitate 2-methyltransferase [Aquabacter spiritensis]TCT05162.1 trans-aconitate 2-methyltransferase [Aquabacter spiritensis]